jgi:dCTP diphosphatase
MLFFKEICKAIQVFRDARDWQQFHSPKNLACSISIEAAELLEKFQWCGTQESFEVAELKKEEIRQEIADVAIYLIGLADTLEIDLLEAISEKLRLNDAKYPAERVRGSSKKYDEYEGGATT